MKGERKAELRPRSQARSRSFGSSPPPPPSSSASTTSTSASVSAPQAAAQQPQRTSATSGSASSFSPSPSPSPSSVPVPAPVSAAAVIAAAPSASTSSPLSSGFVSGVGGNAASLMASSLLAAASAAAAAQQHQQPVKPPTAVRSRSAQNSSTTTMTAATGSSSAAGSGGGSGGGSGSGNAGGGGRVSRAHSSPATFDALRFDAAKRLAAATEGPMALLASRNSSGARNLAAVRRGLRPMIRLWFESLTTQERSRALTFEDPVAAQVLRQMFTDQRAIERPHAADRLLARVNASPHLVLFSAIADPCLFEPRGRDALSTAWGAAGGGGSGGGTGASSEFREADRSDEVKRLLPAEQLAVMQEFDRLRNIGRFSRVQQRLRTFAASRLTGGTERASPARSATGSFMFGRTAHSGDTSPVLLRDGSVSYEQRSEGTDRRQRIPLPLSYDVDLCSAIDPRAEAAEAVLLSSARLGDTREYLDTVTVSPSLFKDADTLFSVLNIASRGLFLSEVCRVAWFPAQDDRQKRGTRKRSVGQWRWLAPSWFRDSTWYYSLARYFCMRLELSLWEKFWLFARGGDPRDITSRSAGRVFNNSLHRGLESLLDKQQLMDFWQTLESSSRRKAIGSIRDIVQRVLADAPASQLLLQDHGEAATSRKTAPFDALNTLLDITGFLTRSVGAGKTFLELPNASPRSHAETYHDVGRVLTLFRLRCAAFRPRGFRRPADATGNSAPNRRVVRSSSGGVLRTAVGDARRRSSVASAGDLSDTNTGSNTLLNARKSLLDSPNVERNLIYVLYFSPLERAGTTNDRILRRVGRAIQTAYTQDLTSDLILGDDTQRHKQERKQDSPNRKKLTSKNRQMVRTTSADQITPVARRTSAITADVRSLVLQLISNLPVPSVQSTQIAAEIHSNNPAIDVETSDVPSSTWTGTSRSRRRRKQPVRMSINDQSRRHRSVSPPRDRVVSQHPEVSGDIDIDDDFSEAATSLEVLSARSSTDRIAVPRHFQNSTNLPNDAALTDSSALLAKDQAVSEWEYFLGLAARQYRQNQSLVRSAPAAPNETRSDSDMDDRSDDDASTSQYSDDHGYRSQNWQQHGQRRGSDLSAGGYGMVFGSFGSLPGPIPEYIGSLNGMIGTASPTSDESDIQARTYASDYRDHRISPAKVRRPRSLSPNKHHMPSVGEGNSEPSSHFVAEAPELSQPRSRGKERRHSSMASSNGVWASVARQGLELTTQPTSRSRSVDARHSDANQELRRQAALESKQSTGGQARPFFRSTSERKLPASSAGNPWSQGPPRSLSVGRGRSMASMEVARDDWDAKGALQQHSYYEQQWLRLHQFGNQAAAELDAASASSQMDPPERFDSENRPGHMDNQPTPVVARASSSRDVSVQTSWGRQTRHMEAASKHSTHTVNTHTGHSSSAGLLQHYSPQAQEKIKSARRNTTRGDPAALTLEPTDVVDPTSFTPPLPQAVPAYFPQMDVLPFQEVQPSILDSCARRLHEEISEFVKLTDWVMDLRLNHCVNPVCNQIRDLAAQLWNVGKKSNSGGVRVERYGSFSTKLCIPSSDVDLVVIFDEDSRPRDSRGAFRQLAQRLRTCQWVQQLQEIDTARVPVIRFLALPITGPAVPPGTKRKPRGFLPIHAYPASAWVEVDITFADSDTVFVSDNGLVPHQGMAAVGFIRRHVEQYPVLKALVLVLKEFLYERGLNVAFMGGLSSYCLVVMCISFLQQLQRDQQETRVEKDENSKKGLGKLLLQFFGYYGSFNFSTMGIKTGVDGGWYRIPPPVDGAQRPPMVIVDPHNSGNNIAPRVYAISRIKELFEQASFVLLAPFYAAFTPSSLLRRLVIMPQVDEWMLRAAEDIPPRLIYTDSPRFTREDVVFPNSDPRIAASLPVAVPGHMLAMPTDIESQTPAFSHGRDQGVFGPTAVNWASSAAAAAVAHHRKASKAQGGKPPVQPASARPVMPPNNTRPRDSSQKHNRKRGTSLGGDDLNAAASSTSMVNSRGSDGRPLWSQVAQAHREPPSRFATDTFSATSAPT